MKQISNEWETVHHREDADEMGIFGMVAHHGKMNIEETV